MSTQGLTPERIAQIRKAREDLKDFTELVESPGWKKLAAHLEATERNILDRILLATEESMLLRDAGAAAQIRAIRYYPQLQREVLTRQLEPFKDRYL